MGKLFVVARINPAVLPLYLLAPQLSRLQQ